MASYSAEVLEFPSPTTEDNAAVNALRPLFAVIIGIDTYLAEDVPDLTGACEDADNVCSFIQDRLRTPLDQIVNLRNKEATRAAIKSAINNLVDNTCIKENDPILIYFAGHGSQTPPPVVEMILPHDFSRQPVGSEIGQGLLDFTIARLLSRIASTKGNNITVIFDCCHSGSGTRIPEQDWVARTIDLPQSYTIFSGVDQDLLGEKGITSLRGSSIPSGFLQVGLHSHVLLAACQSGERAEENRLRKRGFFTHALISTLWTLSMRDVTYKELIRKLPATENQHPQCEGVFKTRKLFDSSISSAEVQTTVYPVTKKANEYTIAAGASIAIAQGDHFDVYRSGDSSTKTSTLIGTLVVKTVSLFDSILQPIPGHPWSFETKGFAIYRSSARQPSTITAVDSHSSSLRVLLDQTDSRLLDVVRSLEEKGDRGNEATRIRTTADKTDAHFVISTKEDKLLFNILDGRCTIHGLMRMPYEPAFDVDRLKTILHSAARFYSYLSLSSSDSDTDNKILENNIQVKCCTLKKEYSEVDKSYVTVEGNDHPIEDGIITICAHAESDMDKAQSPSMYGFKVVSSYMHDVFVSMFYFDNSNLEIESYYQPSSATDWAFVEPSIKAAKLPDEPNILTIGYGSGGGRPHRFVLTPLQRVDVGFLKVFVTTKYVDYGGVVQESPFTTTLRTGDEYVEPPPPAAWYAITVPVVQKRVRIQ